MTVTDYINSVVGLPWVAGSDDPSIGLDCWGLVVDSFRRIDGIELPPLNAYDALDIAAGFAEGMAAGKWQPCGALDGAVVACFDAEDRLDHVGRLLCGKMLHSQGKRTQPGEVTLWPIGVARKFYRLEFYQWR